ncbi:hypothetical protein GCM10028808_73860 [Spirosoma migulaei]
MQDAQSVFKQVYLETNSIEMGIAELKRHGFSQNDTIQVLMHVLNMTVVEADKRVMNSLVWSN